MKKITFTILACVLWFSSFSQWNAQTSGTTNGFTSLYFIDANKGFAVTDLGGIYSTSNAGINWSPIDTAGSSLYSVSFGGANKGCVVGAGGSVLTTVDAGATWSAGSSGQGYALSSVFFVDTDTAYAVGNLGTILKSVNSGMMWSPKISGTSSDLKSVYFTNGITGYAVGLGGTILKTINAGVTWLPQTSGTIQDLLSVNFTDANNGYAVGTSGIILKTTDAGASWSPLNSGTSNTLNSIRFPDANNGYAVGAGGTILKTKDAGSIWYTQISGAPTDLNSVFFTDANNGYAVGINGKILKTTDGGCATPTLSISGATTICAGSSTNLSIIGASTYVWSPGIGLDCSTCPNVSASPTSNTTYSITGTSTEGCSNVTAVSITVNSVSGGNISSSQSICFGGDPAAFTETSPSIGSGTLVYQWKNSTDGYSAVWATTQTYDAPAGSTATTTYRRITKSTLGGVSCIANSNDITVTVNPLPLANAGTDVPICLGNSTTLTASGGTSYTWYNGGSSISAAVSLTVNPLTTTTYKVEVANSFGCSNSDSVIVTVIPIPVITATTPASRCGTGTVNLGATVSDGIIHWWDAETGGTDLGTGTTFTTPSISDTTTYYVNATNGCVPATRTPVIATVNSIPLLTTTVTSSAICIGTNATLTASGTGITTYLWSTGEITSSITDSPSTTSTYTVTGTDANSCSDTATITITVNPLPAMTNVNTATICSGATINIPLTSDVTSTYSWIAADNLNTNGESLTTESTATLTNVIFTTSGPQNVVYSVIPISTGGSCTGITQTITVMVYPLPIVNGGTDTTICAGQSTKLTANGNANSYIWNNGVTNGVPFIPSITNSYVVGGTSNGCSQYDTVLVTVNSLPAVNGGSDTIICAGQSAILIASGGAAYVWSTGSSANSISVAPTATITYGVTGTTNGCSNTDSVLVTVNSIPTVSAGINDTICEGENKTLTGAGDATSYSWNNGVTNATAFTPSATATYVVTGTTNGCSNTDSVLVTVNPAPLANAGTGATICHSDSTILSGTGGVSFSWSNGFTTATITVNPDTSTSYILTVTDNSGCTASDTTMVSVTPSKDIFGHVSYSGGPVTSGMAVLYKYEQFQTRFDSVQYVPLNPSSGDYVFTNVNYGQYLVKVVVDSASYPTLINTYYGDEFLWDGDSVRVINHTCNLNTTLDSVTMAELTGTGGGIGLIIGQIIEGISFGRVEGEPIPGVDVKLGKNPGGSIVATTNTDSTGHFTFEGVANGNYTIYVDIPGLGRDSSYTFTLDSTNNQFLNQNYIADSNIVYINPTSTVGISNSANSLENKFNVYPNPVKGNTTIEYTIPEMTDSKTTLEVYNLLGVKISSLVNATQQPGIYKYYLNPQKNNLNSGVYFISLTIDGKANTKRIVVIE